MGKLSFIGAATAVQQVDTITLSGTFASTETVTIKVAEKQIVYTCGSGETVTTVAAGLVALCSASSDPEFAEVTWTSAVGVITAKSKAGVPVTIAVSETAASGTAVLANVTAATGPNHWDNVDNWSTGAVPTTSDEVFIESKDAAVLYGLPTSLTLGKLVVKDGQLGLLDRNPAGYTEYRTKRPIITCTDVQIGRAAGVGPALCRLSTASANAVVTVFGSSRRTDVPAVELLLNHSSSQVNVIAGQVGVAVGGEQTSTVGTIRVSAEGAVSIGSGTTLTTLVSSGVTDIAASSTNLTVDDGTTTLLGTATVTNLIVRGGTLVHKSTGTITNATVGPGTLDCSKDLRPRTITALTVKRDGTVSDQYNSLTISGISLDASVDKLHAL